MYKIYGKRTLMLLLSGALLIALFSFTGCAANLDNTAETTASHAPSATVAVTPVQAVAAAAPVHQTTNFKITLDVNPSIELTVTNGVISGVTAYNDDAQALLLGVDVSGLSADDAVKTLVNALNKDGYLNNGETKPYLIITVNDPSKSTGKLAEALKKDAKEALKQLSVKCNVRTAGVSPEIASAAQKLGISSGRYLLLAHISGKENITIEEALAKYGSMKIAELMHLHEDNEDIFDDKSEDQEDEDLAKELTPEQLSKLEAARSQYAAAVHAAESAYYAALTQAKQNFKSQWASAKSQYSEDKAALLAALKSVKAEFKAARNAARGILKQAITTAQAAFKSTVPGLGCQTDNWKIFSIIRWMTISSCLIILLTKKVRINLKISATKTIKTTKTTRTSRITRAKMAKTTNMMKASTITRPKMAKATNMMKTLVTTIKKMMIMAVTKKAAKAKADKKEKTIRMMTTADKRIKYIYELDSEYAA